MYKNTQWLRLLLLTVFGAVLLMKPITISADSDKSVIGFNVMATIPQNQIDANQSFFDLKMAPGQTQNLTTTIYNSTNKEMKIETKIRTAFTNNNGNIEYFAPLKKADASLKYRMDDITKLDDKDIVTVPANSEKKVTATVKIPDGEFNGVIQGGWYFKRIDDKVTGNVKDSLNIKNQYAYVVGLKYVLGKLPSPHLELDKVGPGLSNYHQSINSDLRNTAAIMVPKMAIKTTITNKADGKKVVSTQDKSAEMAPNSNYHYPILTNNKTLSAGKYHLHMLVESKSHHWVFDRDFTITKKEAQKYNRESVTSKVISIWWYIFLGAFGMFLLGGIIMLLIWLWRRKRKTASE